MSKDVGLIVEVPYEVSYEADFAVPVFISETLARMYLSHSWMSESQKGEWLWRILRSCRKEIDSWGGDKPVYEVECDLPVAFHACCQSCCTELVALKAGYRKHEAGEISLQIMLPDETWHTP